jgi:hypothetical protein
LRKRLLIVLALLAAFSPAASAAAAQLAISPQPGTPDASPSTQISILGVARREIQSVTVTGSLSGVHAGRLRSYSGGQGASFVLAHPLTQGESVMVTIRIKRRAAIRFKFTVAKLAPILPFLNAHVLQPAKLQHFVATPQLLPPKITILKRSSKLTGDIFLTPLPSPIVHPESNNELTINPVGPGGPMIIDPQGRLIWFDQLTPPMVAANFRPQRYAGHEVLTWWQGGVTISAYGIGEGVIASTSYRMITTVHAGNGYAGADLHEFVLTPSGDALMTIYSPVEVHVPGTPPGALTSLLDAIVQEVDVRTGLVVWEWHSLGHIPLQDSYATTKNSIDLDAYHINAIQQLPRDRLLISARDTSAVYELDQASGRILWTLGGKASSFRLGPGARFYFQHDAQLIAPNRVSLFDDEAGPPDKAKSSRGLVLALDLRDHRATVAHQYMPAAPGTLADSEGSVQTLPGGDVFVGFGSEPFFAQFSELGRVLFNARLPIDDGSYREYEFPWSATPPTRPAIAARRGAGKQVSVYASWNGATTVARWQVLGGARSMSVVGSAPDRGFETRIAVSSSAKLFAVRALDAHGRMLARSAAVAAQ